MALSRSDIDAKYGGKPSTQAPTITSDGMALQAPGSSGQPASNTTARQKIDEKYGGPRKPITKPASTTTASKPADIVVPEKKGLISRVTEKASKITDRTLNFIDSLTARKDDSEMGTSVAKNTIKNLPSSFVENIPFGFGAAIKAIRDNEDLAAEVAGSGQLDAIKNLAVQTPKAVVETAKEFVKSPIRGASNLAFVPVKFNIPGLGEISNAQYNAAYRIQNGEDPVVVNLQEGAGAIFDTLFFTHLASKPFQARPTTIMKGEFHLPQNTPVSSGPKSFRLYEAPTTAQTVSPQFIEQMRAQGSIIPKSYNPANPTIFRVTQSKPGVFTGELIQLKPSYYNVIKGKITANTTPGGEVILYHGTSKENADSIRKNGFDLERSRMGEQGAKAVDLASNRMDAANYGGDVLAVRLKAKDIKTFSNTEAYMTAVEKQFGVFNGANATKFNNQFGAVKVQGALPNGDMFMVGNPKNLSVQSPGMLDNPFPALPLPKVISPDQGEVIFSKEVKESDIDNAVQNPVIQTPDGGIVSPRVNEILTKPIDQSVLDYVEQFTPDEASAFGKKIITRINESVGTKISDEAAASIPSDIKITEMESPDGRTAQFNNQGRIEVFLPNLVKDISDLAKGEQIYAHPDTPKYSKVYELKDGESIDELAVRYIRDVLVHEKSHEKTMTLEDANTKQRLYQEVVQARMSGKGLTEAQTKLDGFMKGLEEKALAYERQYRSQLENEMFPAGDATKIQRKINQIVAGGPQKKVTVTEKTLLKERFKSQAQGARAGLEKGKEIGDKKVEATKTKYESVLETLKDKNATMQQRRFALVTYAETFLPIRVRGKFIRSINYPGSDKNFQEILTRMQKASDTVTRNGLMRDIVSELKGTIVKKVNGLPNVKFERFAQLKLNSIRANIKGDYSMAQVRITTKISDWQTQHPDDVLPDNLIEEIEMLRMVGIQDMTAKELRSVLNDIKSIKETGKTLRELERFNRDTEIERARDQIKAVLTGGQELPSKSLSIKQDKEETVMQNVKEFLTDYQYGLEEVLDDLSKLDKGTKQYESFLSKYVSERANKAFNEQNKGERENIDIVNTKIKEIYKLEKNSEVLSHINEMNKVVDLGKIIHADGVERTLMISRGQAIQMHMWLQDPTLADTFAQTLNWSETVIDTVNNFLKPEDVQLGNYLVDEFYPKYYEGINEVFVKEFGVDLPFNEKYSPVARDVEVLMPENVLLAQETKQYATARNNSLKNRVQNRTELRTTDVLENLTRHIVRMEHYKAWSQSMSEFRKIFGNKEIRQAIIDFHGKTPLKVVDNFLNDFARDGVAREKVIKQVDIIRSNATKALLGLNWKVGFKQLSGVLNYAIEMPFTDFTAGVSGFWKDPVNKARFLYKNSQVLQERFGEGFERDIKFAISKGYDQTLSKTKSLSEFMFVLIRNADKLTVYQGSWAAYRSAYMEAKKAGKSDAEAKAAGITNAENITNRVQESSRLDTLSPIQRGGSLAKIFTMFQSQPSKYLRIIMNSARNYKYGRGSKANHAKRIAMSWFIVPLIYNLIAEMLVDEKYKATNGQLLVKTALGPLSYPLITGQMFMSVYGWVGGERFAYTPSAMFAFMEDIKKTVENFKTGDAVEAITYMIDTMGKIKGVPTGLFTKPLRDNLKDN